MPRWLRRAGPVRALTPRRAPRRLPRATVLGVTAAVLAAAAGTAYAAMSPSAPAYRLATAAAAHVTATMHVVGTLTPVREAEVAFPVSGSVAGVAVTVGQHVHAGQTLGSLATTSLKARLTSAKSVLASAEARISSDTSSQAAAAATTSQPSPSSSSLGTLQQAVLGGQRQADRAIQRARAAVDQAGKACAAGSSPSPAPSPSPSPTGTAPAAAPSPAGTSPGGGCASAEQQALAAETALMKAQQELAAALSKLGKALSAAGTGTASGTGGNGGGRGTGTVSAAQLAADQAAADAAAAQVTVARQNLDAATVVSPVSGTVVAVNVTPGTSTGPGSTAFSVAGLDSYQVVAAVSVADIPGVKTGQRASVLPDGTSTPIAGSVVAIGLVPSASGSPVTYPVTISLTGSPSGLHAGGSASVTITTAEASGVTVPTSAVHGSGRFAEVTVYAGGKTELTRVTVGTRGPVLTQVTGLKAGQQVVLADLRQPLPTNTPGGGRFRGPGGPGVVRFAGG